MILISSLITLLLQVMCAKLGIVTGMDLAQTTKALVGKRTDRRAVDHHQISNHRDRNRQGYR
ncbi:MAG: divalent metal cation transporter [Sodalis sp. (in: enterobacteria)]|uniref:divalent metal cation transporter n=1 Tax=Sodalis sp. (in: enterobacteria) TaxID=1898979 RepID=UPI003F37B52C